MGGVEDEAEVRFQSRGDAVERPRRHVEHPTAGATLHVGVTRRLHPVAVCRCARFVTRPLGLRGGEVIDRRGSAEVHVGQFTDLRQGSEGAIDRGPVDGRLELGHAQADLLGGEVLVAVVGGVEDA